MSPHSMRFPLHLNKRLWLTLHPTYLLMGMIPMFPCSEHSNTTKQRIATLPGAPQVMETASVISEVLLGVKPNYVRPRGVI